MSETPDFQNQAEIKSGFSREDIERFLQSYDDTIRKTMFLQAQEVRDKEAISYRGFKVGCAAAAIEKKLDGTEKLKIRAAANYTPEKKPKIPEGKWCAERVAIMRALKEGGAFIPAIVTVSSEVDPGNGEGAHDVLNPCKECRNLYRYLLTEGYLDPESKVCNINDKDPKHLVMEEMSVTQLLAQYPKDLETSEAAL